MPSRSVSIPGPVMGLVLNKEISTTDGRAAEHLVNWWPTHRGARVRGGIQHVSNTDDAVVSMFSYDHPTNGALFAATETKVFDISALNPAANGTEVITGQTAGYYSDQQIGTSGGEYLYIVNGADLAQVYDGANWQQVTGASSPIAITGVTTSLLSHVWLWKNRLFFVEKDTLTAHYLPAGSVGGAVSQVSLAGVFQRGGSLMFGATWSTDSGSGPDDFCAFFSTRGEVAIYQGTDPSSASTWAIVGRYDLSPPLGIKAHMTAGGDLIVATKAGLIPLSAAIQKDAAALNLAAVTRPIEPLWETETETASLHWEVIKWSDRNLAFVTLPNSSSDKVLGVNLQTGGWGVATGWAAECGVVHNNQAYMGASTGKIYAMDETGQDDGDSFVAQYCASFLDLKAPAAYKNVQMMRGTFLTRGEFAHKPSVSVDFTVEFPTAPAQAENESGDGEFLVWDSGNWDEKFWGFDNQVDPQTAAASYWESVTGAGFAVAPCYQITSGSTDKLDIELIRVDMLLEVGGIAV